jgi:hypothetical protein
VKYATLPPLPTADCGIPLALLPSTRGYLLADRIVICGTKPELLLRPFIADIKGKLIEYDVTTFPRDSALRVATSIFSAAANTDDPNVGSIRRPMRRPPRQAIFHDPVWNRGVSRTNQSTQRLAIH